MNYHDVYEKMGMLRENISKVIIGQSDTIDLVLTALLAGGHVLLEDVPGTGKTMMARSLAASIDGVFSRIQFTPDILPMDITGTSIFNQKDNTFDFRKGPVFCNILLADEINRATPRTQSALLECMEEKQITYDGITYPLQSPFLVIATQNPIETQGTFPLPEAQLDRFLIKTCLGYLSTDDALNVLKRFVSQNPLQSLTPVTTVSELNEASMLLSDVRVSEPVMKYIVAIVEKTRVFPDVLMGVSPRGSLALMRSAQAWSVLHDRDYVLPDDVKRLAYPVLGHRIVCRNAYEDSDSQKKVIDQVLTSVEVPTEPEENE